MPRQNSAGRPRTARRLLYAPFVLLLAVILIYVVVNCFTIFYHPYKTETAIAYTMAETVDVKGVAVFDAVRVEGGGDLGYLVDDGERVTNGTVVAECYTSDDQGVLRERLDRLDRTISLLEKSQNSTGTDLSMLTTQTRQALYNLLDKLDTAAYSGLADAEDEFLLAQNRLQISTGQTEDFNDAIASFEAERDEIQARLDTLQTVTAPTNGYFVSAAAMPSVEPDADALAAAGPAELAQMLEEGFPAAAQDGAGQIVTGFSWKFYAVCDADTAARLDGLSSVKLTVPGKQNDGLTATVSELTLDEESGTAKLVLECQSINAAVLGFGVENARIELQSYEGIRIDKNALHIVDGARGVYVKYGNLQKFLRITVLYENDSYILVPSDGAVGTENEVRLYDEIIVEGANLRDGKLL